MPITITTNAEFGKKYRDKVSGFEGICVAVNKFQFGCVRIGLQGKVKEDGKLPDPCWFDEPSLEGVEIVNKDPGGPRPNPSRNFDPQ